MSHHIVSASFLYMSPLRKSAGANIFFLKRKKKKIKWKKKKKIRPTLQEKICQSAGTQETIFYLRVASVVRQRMRNTHAVQTDRTFSDPVIWALSIGGAAVAVNVGEYNP